MCRRLIALAVATLAFLPFKADAQQTRVYSACGGAAWTANELSRPLQLLATGELCVNATVNASISGFHWESSLTPLAVTTTTASSAAFTAGKTVVVDNVGATNDIFCRLGPTATTAAKPIKPGTWMAFTSTSETVVACITAASTSTANIQVGTGLPTGAGGSGSGGGGGAVTMASGAVASGAYAAGSLAAGAGVDGWDLTQGAIGDASVSAGATGSISAKLRRISTDIDAVKTAATTPLDNSSVPINVSTATTTQLVAISASTLVRVTAWDVIAGGTGTIKFVYGTGTNCGTGTTDLTGAYPLTAQAGIARGDGLGTLFKTPAGNALCVTTSAAVQMSGVVTYQQF